MRKTVKIKKIASHSINHRFIVNDKFFDEPVIVEVKFDKIIFTHPTIDYQGPYYNPSKNEKYNSYVFFVINDYLQEGEFPIDMDESDEDHIVIYFEDKIEEK